MARGATQTEISTANRKCLYALRRRLLKDGINSRYNRKTAALDVVGSNVEWAAFRLLRASNGECALYPRVKYRDNLLYEGWDAFNQIRRTV